MARAHGPGHFSVGDRRKRPRCRWALTHSYMKSRDTSTYLPHDELRGGEAGQRPWLARRSCQLRAKLSLVLEKAAQQLRLVPAVVENATAHRPESRRELASSSGHRSQVLRMQRSSQQRVRRISSGALSRDSAWLETVCSATRPFARRSCRAATRPPAARTAPPQIPSRQPSPISTVPSSLQGENAGPIITVRASFLEVVERRGRSKRGSSAESVGNSLTVG